jgi:hypothetical protein
MTSTLCMKVTVVFAALNFDCISGAVSAVFGTVYLSNSAVSNQLHASSLSDL